MEPTQNTIATINHLCTIWIKVHNHFSLFDQSLKKLAIVKRLFWQSETCFKWPLPLYRGAHPIVEWFTQESMNRLSARTKKSANCGKVAVSGGSTV